MEKPPAAAPSDTVARASAGAGATAPLAVRRSDQGAKLILDLDRVPALDELPHRLPRPRRDRHVGHHENAARVAAAAAVGPVLRRAELTAGELRRRAPRGERQGLERHPP